MAFARIMATAAGRLVRIVAGIVLIAVGLVIIEDSAGLVLALIGLIPLLAGMLNICLIAPLLGAPLSGRDAQR